MIQRGKFYSREKATVETLRYLEEDVDSDTEVERNENEVNVSGETNIVEEVLDSIITESSISNTTQRDEQSSDESKGDYCINEKSNKEATVLAMCKSRDGFLRSKI